MFTGLVREVGRITSVRQRAAITLLDLSAPRTAKDLAIGDSLAVNGICLTVTGIAGDIVRVEATAETRRVTTLERWRPGLSVHLEPSLRAGDAIGGHFVLGHVDGVGRLAALTPRGGAAVMSVTLDRGLAQGLAPKGSVAVDGVSLTLDEGPFADRFSVTLVPHTLTATRFSTLHAGAELNLELDILAKAARMALGPASRPGAGATHAGGGSTGGGRSALTVEALLARGWTRGSR